MMPFTPVSVVICLGLALMLYLMYNYLFRKPKESFANTVECRTQFTPKYPDAIEDIYKEMKMNEDLGITFLQQLKQTAAFLESARDYEAEIEKRERKHVNYYSSHGKYQELDFENLNFKKVLPKTESNVTFRPVHEFKDMTQFRIDEETLYRMKMREGMRKAYREKCRREESLTFISSLEQIRRMQRSHGVASDISRRD